MERVLLPEPVSIAQNLQDVLIHRHSAVSGNPEEPITLVELSALLGHSLRKRPKNTTSRNYPSGGALYPVETYLISTAIETQLPSVFHYNPSEHSLERLWPLPEAFDMKSIAKHPESLPLSTLIVFTSVWRRSAAKYGDLAYQHALLEAGHMSENILLVATALEINARPYAGFEDNLIAELLDLDETEEQSVHTVTICK
ncbi:MAG: SagB/ThcOx family dehydrogenase [Candidatus Pacebacteria bacterium]|nr:SagB/ThcOx family dehydrogenase [Candidatus Paceibacterota bacterium]